MCPEQRTRQTPVPAYFTFTRFAAPAVVLAAMLVAASSFGTAQESKSTKAPETKAAEKSAEPKGTEKEKSDKPKGRLPAGYGKLELSEMQRDKIYGIQAKFSPKLDELERQIEKLRAERDAEIEGVLTAAQKQTLAENETKAKEKRAEKSKTDGK